MNISSDSMNSSFFNITNQFPLSFNSFDFSSLLSILNSSYDPLYHDPNYLDKYLIDKHIDKIKTWMKKNYHHTFPKSKEGWLNVFYMHFQKLCIHMDFEKILQMIKSDQESKSPKINNLVKHMRKLMRRRTFALITDPRTHQRLLAHCNIQSYATPEQLYNRMIQLGLISDNKRKVKLNSNVKEINDISDITYNFKKIRV